MIIKSIRCKKAKVINGLRAHIFRGQENDEITILRGTESDILDFASDANISGKEYAVRHFIIAPANATSRTQIFQLIEMLAAEFDFNGDNVVLVEHVKPRATGDAFGRHWHLLVPEYDASKGRVLSSSHDHLRHEYISRIFEFRFGQAVTLGAHTSAVIRRLRAEGRCEIADALSDAYRDSPEPQPRSAFTHGAHKRAARANSDIPADRQFVRRAWLSTSDRRSLIASLAAGGLTVRRGEKEGEHVLWRGDTFIGSLRRLAHISKAELTSRMEGPDDRRTAFPEKCSSDNFESHGGNGAEVECGNQSDLSGGERPGSEREGISRGGDEIAENIGRRDKKDQYFSRGSSSGNSDSAHTIGNRSRIAGTLKTGVDNRIQEIEKLSSRVKERTYYSFEPSEGSALVKLNEIEKTLSELVARRAEIAKSLRQLLEEEKKRRSVLNALHMELDHIQDEIDATREKSVRKFLWFRWSSRSALQKIEQLELKRQSIQQSARIGATFVVGVVARVASSESALNRVQMEISQVTELISKKTKDKERAKIIGNNLMMKYPDLKFVGSDYMAKICDYIEMNELEGWRAVSTRKSVASL